VTFNVTNSSAIVTYNRNGESIIQTASQSDFDTYLPDGGIVHFALLETGVFTRSYLSLGDVNSIGACGLLKDQATQLLELPDRTAVLVFTYKMNNESWTLCKHSERYRLLNLFANAGSREMARLMREALGLTTVSRYDTEFDYLGIADLKIVTAGYNCVDFHTGARIDVICPGGRDCPILRPTGVLDLNLEL